MTRYEWYKIGKGKKFHLIPTRCISLVGGDSTTLCNIGGILTDRADDPDDKDCCQNCLRELRAIRSAIAIGNG